MALFNFLQQSITIALHIILNVEAISFAIG